MTESGFPPGSRVEIRDEEWLVLGSKPTDRDGTAVRVLGQSTLVRGEEATFFEKLDRITVMKPEDTELVDEGSPHFIQSRLFLEAILRRTPVPRTETRLAMSDSFLLDRMTYQQRPAELALKGLRPRVLIADVVGLGKTLEIGITLAELIRRGRGDRILVVTPQHVLEQFQRELWTRFSIPLLRMDSVGISRIQQRLPAGRNPFTVFKRVIVSVDTLKNEETYKHHLENVAWDAVVFDESHNLIGGKSKSLRRKLAEVIAPRTDALLLASATPHNGDATSFAELIDLLDPTAIADKTDYTAADIASLYIRRTKRDREVREAVHKDWAERGDTQAVPVPATEAEERVFAELAKIWFAGDTNVVASRRRLFPYTLLKSFLSSPTALAETVRNRLRSATGAETIALNRLESLTEDIAEPAKFTALVNHLRQIGVGPKSDTRVVVFSERIPTLTWLSEAIPAALKLKPNQVRILHGGLADNEQMAVVEEFGLAASPVRVLFTGDVASEGVNLHRQCHELVHYDVPWSLIRIEQRNGRIDRYGQRESPQFTALLLNSRDAPELDDRLVSEKLLNREEAAHRSIGTVEPITGEYDAKQEEDRLLRDLLAGKTVDESMDAAQAAADADPLALIMAGQTSTAPEAAARPVEVTLPALFTDTHQFVTAALDVVDQDLSRTSGIRLNPRWEGDVLLLDPPGDLQKRLKLLPPGYLKERKVLETLQVTPNQKLADKRLEAARQSEDTAWPDTAYLSDLHPLVDWLVDKALLRLGRGKAPIIYCDVTEPTYCVQGVYTNRAGQPAVVEWMAVDRLTGNPRVGDLTETLTNAGIGSTMTNPGLKTHDKAPLTALIAPAIAAARKHLETRRIAWDATIAAQINEHRERLGSWQQHAIAGLEAAPSKAKRRSRIEDTATSQRRRIEDLATTDGQPLLRLLAVLVPHPTGQ